ncbi:MAG TPA: hypothetical protein DCG34_08675 [Clostridiales bacterium]|nr:hypothetical protein [Clostridiales bacterium]
MSKVKIASIVVIVLALVGTGIYMLLPKEDPLVEMSTFEKFEAALARQSEIKEADMLINFNIDIATNDPSMTRMAEILREVDFNYNIKQNMKSLDNLLIEGLLSMSYHQEPALNLDFYMDGEKIIFGSKDLITQLFYLNFKDYEKYMQDILASYGNESQMPSFSMDVQEIMRRSVEFRKEFYSLEGIEGIENFNGDKYRDMLEEGLEGLLIEVEPFDVPIMENGQIKQVSCRGMQLVFNETQLIELMIPILEEAKNDGELKKIIITKAEQYMTFANTLYSIDYEAMGIEDPYAAINEGIDDLEENYIPRIEELIKILNDYKETYSGRGFSIDNIIGIDNAGMIIYWDMALTANLGLGDTAGETIKIRSRSITNSYNQSLEFSDYSKITEEGINVVELMAYPDSVESQMVLMQLYGSFMQKMSLNPLFRDIIMEIGVY